MATDPKRMASRIFSGQVELLYKGAFEAYLATIVNATILAYVQSPVIRASTVISWLVYVLVVTAARAALVYRYWHSPDRINNSGQWNLVYIAGVVLAGMGWGLGGLLLYPPEDIFHQVFLVFMLGGMAAGAVGVLASRMEAFLSFVVPTLLPVMILLFMQHDSAHATMGVMVLIYLLGLLWTAKRLHRSIAYSLHLGTENADLVSNLQIANEQLQSLSQLKSSFVSTVAHELRTPLTSIKGYVENVLDGFYGALNQQQVYHLERVAYNVDRFARLINDLLDLSRIEAGRVELNRSPVLVTQLLADIMDFFQPTADRKGVVLRTNHLGMRMIDGDRDKLIQILTNLVQNALKFTSPGGEIRIEITASTGEGFVQFGIHDTGCGIPVEELDKVFDGFYRGRSVPSQQGGAGLGLAITKSLVELHGGKIWAESQIGRGSSFFFTIPTGGGGQQADA